MKKRNLTCIGCPMGCSIDVTLEDGHIVSVCGNTCKRGEEYAISECTAPTRMLTTTVRTHNENIMLPVKSASALPKEKLFVCMKLLADVVMPLPVKIGDVVFQDICDTGIDIVAAKNIKGVQTYE